MSFKKKKVGGSVELEREQLMVICGKRKKSFYVNVLWELEKASYEEKKKDFLKKKKILTRYFKIFEQESLIKINK